MSSDVSTTYQAGTLQPRFKCRLHPRNVDSSQGRVVVAIVAPLARRDCFVILTHCCFPLFFAPW